MMKKSIILVFTICLSKLCFAQDSLKQTSFKKNRIFIHLYPSAIAVGDVSFGAEHLYKKRFSQEFAVNIKCFTSPIYDYNRGYRLNYLIKYNLYNGKIFRFSTNLFLFYLDINYKNFVSGWGFQISPAPPPVTFLWDGELKEYGWGLGFSFNFKLHKRFFLGSDIAFLVVKDKPSYVVEKQVNGYIDPNVPPLPYTNNPSKYEIYHVVPYFTIKLSYLII